MYCISPSSHAVDFKVLECHPDLVAAFLEWIPLFATDPWGQPHDGLRVDDVCDEIVVTAPGGLLLHCLVSDRYRLIDILSIEAAAE